MPFSALQTLHLGFKKFTMLGRAMLAFLAGGQVSAVHICNARSEQEETLAMIAATPKLRLLSVHYGREVRLLTRAHTPLSYLLEMSSGRPDWSCQALHIMDNVGEPDSAAIAVDAVTNSPQITLSGDLDEAPLLRILQWSVGKVQELYLDCRALTLSTVRCIAQIRVPCLRVLHIGSIVPEIDDVTVMLLLRQACLPDCDVRLTGPVSDEVKSKFSGYVEFG
jgi:hypothetical protein